MRVRVRTRALYRARVRARAGAGASANLLLQQEVAPQRTLAHVSTVAGHESDERRD